MLTRYWIELDKGHPALSTSPYRAIVGFGCGVTALSVDDAIAILSSALGAEELRPAITAIAPDVDISGLDPGHVLTNLGDPSRRGIWFPSGL
jgi:hypothetical protein